MECSKLNEWGVCVSLLGRILFRQSPLIVYNKVIIKVQNYFFDYKKIDSSEKIITLKLIFTIIKRNEGKNELKLKKTL